MRRPWVLAASSLVAALLLLPPPLASAAAASPTKLITRVALGAHAPPAPYTGMAAFTDLERLTGRLELVHLFQQWQGPTADFHKQWLDNARSGSRKVLLTWEPWDPTQGVAQPRFRLADIARGALDGYVTTWAHRLAQYHHVVYLRPMHEMNGTWYPWAGGVNGNTAADYIAAWRHLHGVFTRVGASNVRWVWSPNADDVPSSNAFESYYPGGHYVDVLALDGYNWGAAFPQNGGWRSFHDIFAAAYGRITRLGAQPVWIAETASSPVGGDKTAWVQAAMSDLGFPRLRAIVWFNVDKEQDWRLSSPPSAGAVLKWMR